MSSPTPPPPPAFGTVLAADDTVVPPPTPPPPAKGLGIATVITVAAVVSIGVGAATWFFLGRSPAAVAEPTTAAASVAPSVDEPTPAAAAAAAPNAPVCASGMVEISGGKFFMGTDAEDRVLASAKPAHQVEVESFCIDTHEVTLAAYRECSEGGECKRAYRESQWPQGSADEETWAHDKKVHSALCNEGLEGREDHPVNCVTWHQAKAYCEWRGAALPTEAQWEFAARGSDGRIYSWGDGAPDSEHMNGCGLECTAWREKVGVSATPRLYEVDDGFVGTAPVGSFQSGKTQHGLYDIAGNVFEWTASKFEPYDEVERLAAASEDDPTRRVIRGGAFNSFLPSFADPALRFGQVESAHSHGIGFRCASQPSSSR